MRTLLSPEELLERLHQLEQEANRERIIHWGPRTLDLDILFYDQEIIDTADLHIPHPDMQNRDFVLAPMNQIAPYLRHPAPNRRVNEKIYITVTCPSCGAKNQIIKGRLCNCEYCGQRLTSLQHLFPSQSQTSQMRACSGHKIQTNRLFLWLFSSSMLFGFPGRWDTKITIPV